MMKGFHFLAPNSLAFGVALTLLLVVVVSPGSHAELTFGATCGHPISEFCSKESGLICGPDKKCLCSHGAVASGLEYKIEWNTNERKCFAQPDTPCFGTKEFPAPAGQNTAVCTSNYECTALKGLPPGTGLCKPKTTLQTYGVPCNKDTFCEKAAGLICNEEFRCGCSKGVVSHELEYKFAWNATVGKCLAEEGSACHTNPDVTVAQCGYELVCTQVEDTVPGVGVCKGINHNPDPEPTTPDPEPTTPDSATLVGLNMLLLSGTALILLKM